MSNEFDPEKKVIDFTKAHRQKARRANRRKRLLVTAALVAALLLALVLLVVVLQVRELFGGGDFWHNFQGSLFGGVF